MTMFETLCRTAANANGRPPVGFTHEPNWKLEGAAVRAVLEAMEQPSPEMRRAILESMNDAIALGDPRAREWYCGAGWKAGVRAILDEAG